MPPHTTWDTRTERIYLIYVRMMSHFSVLLIDGTKETARFQSVTNKTSKPSHTLGRCKSTVFSFTDKRKLTHFFISYH